jgi:predicted ATP-grasp superfamily ATP-dependent carboligase
VSGDGARAGALVVGGDYQGLGIVRSLGRRGIPTCVVDDERSIARFSRYTTSYVRQPNLREEDDVVAALLEVAERLDLHGWVLFPTRDETVAALSKRREELSRWFRVPTPAWDRVRWAWDKRLTYELAQRLGIPYPRTWYPARDGLDAVDRDGPYAIKPAIKEHFIYATKAKAWRADTRLDVAARLAEAESVLPLDEVVVQELVPGNGESQVAYCAFFKNGEALGKMVVNRRRQHPPQFGRASTYVETIVAPEVEELSERLLREIDYYGLVEIEYKRDARTGEYKLLDFNARTWGYHSLGFPAGVDFPYLLYADQVGDTVTPAIGAAGVSWVRLVTDLPSGLLEIVHRRLGLRSYLRTVRRATTESVFSRDDFLPGLVEIGLVPYLSIKRGF